MSPVLLGTTLAAGFIVAWAARRPLEKFLITSLPADRQPKRQFFVDILLYISVGCAVALFNKTQYGFPLIFSGSMLVLGCAIVGFFSALDMALARERTVIHLALEQGKVSQPPKRLYSATRKFTLVAVTTTLFVAIIIVLIISKDISWLVKIDQNVMSQSMAKRSVMIEIFFIMTVLLAMVANLIVSYSKNLKILFNNETHILERVTQGDLSKLVPVTTKDEFGVIAGHTNTMIQGLRHRIKLIAALKLAEEVQQNLLPRTAPAHPGLDISGTSIYCYETGGDYYDFFKLPDNRFGVVVADASDHGVGAALHMTTARAFLLFGIQNFSDSAQLIADVNSFLTKDSAETGRFMSMFFLEIDVSAKTLRWVRAGHEPAILYDPVQDSFLDLTGEGLALGVDQDFDYKAYSRNGWTPGSVVFVGTDGIREARNQQNEMFGLDRLQNVLRKHASESAEALQNAVIAELHSFQGGFPQEDDITLIVIKLL